MNTNTINQNNTTNIAGVPPAPPKTHQKAGWNSERNYRFIEACLFDLMNMANLVQNDALERAYMGLIDDEKETLIEWLENALIPKTWRTDFVGKVERLLTYCKQF